MVTSPSASTKEKDLKRLINIVHQKPGASIYKLAESLDWPFYKVMRLADDCVRTSDMYITVGLSSFNGRPAWLHWPLDMSASTKSLVDAAMLLAICKVDMPMIGVKFLLLQERMHKDWGYTKGMDRVPFTEPAATIVDAALTSHRLGGTELGAELTMFAMSKNKIGGLTQEIRRLSNAKFAIKNTTPFEEWIEWADRCAYLSKSLHKHAQTVILDGSGLDKWNKTRFASVFTSPTFYRDQIVDRREFYKTSDDCYTLI